MMNEHTHSRSHHLPVAPALESAHAEGPLAGPPGNAMEYDYTNYYNGPGDDAFEMLGPFADWWARARPQGYYLYELPLHTQGAWCRR